MAPVLKEWPRPTKPCHKCGGGRWTTVNAEGDWCEKCWEDRCRKRTVADSIKDLVIRIAESERIMGTPKVMLPLPAPTCAGPLATHGTPVLRWITEDAGIAIVRTRKMLCDACYLEYEQKVAAMSELLELVPFSPTARRARIGTVPQVFGLNVGVWASRGMR